MDNLEWELRYLMRNMQAKDSSLRAFWHVRSAREALKVVSELIGRSRIRYKQFPNAAEEIAQWEPALGAWIALVLVEKYVDSFTRLAAEKNELAATEWAKSKISALRDVWCGTTEATVLDDAFQKASYDQISIGFARRQLFEAVDIAVNHSLTLLKYGHAIRDNSYDVMLRLASNGMYTLRDKYEHIGKGLDYASARQEESKALKEFYRYANGELLQDAFATFPLPAMRLYFGNHGGAHRNALYQVKEHG